MSLAEVYQAYLVVSSEAARTYFNLLALSKRMQLTQNNLEEREQAYKLTTSLSESGLGNDLDVSRALAQVEQAKSFLLLLSSEKEMAKNYLSTLLGISDYEFNDSFDGLPEFPNAVLVKRDFTLDYGKIEFDYLKNK